MKNGIAQLLPILVLFALVPAASSEDYHAAILRTGLAAESSALLEALGKEAEGAGCIVEQIDLAGICDPAVLSASRINLLVLSDASALPADSVAAIEAYLKAGGDLLALNAPLWQRQLIQDGDAWLDRDQFAAAHEQDLMQHALFDFDSQSIDGWRRTANDGSNPTIHEIADSASAPFQKALHVSIVKLSGWDTFVSPPLDAPFPEGHTLTVFHAKGGPDTGELAVEWTERDGSRWIATVPLTESWRQYVLAPSDFRYWESVPARADTAFDPLNAASFTVGLAHTHTRLTGETHEYWVGPVGTAARTPVHDRLLKHVSLPALELLSPGYKFFPMDAASFLYVRKDQAIIKKGLLPTPAAMLSTHPRPRAGGFGKGRAWRWLPLLQATTANGQWRGVPAAMLVHADGPYRGGVWASFAIGDMEWYAHPEALACLSGVMKAMRRGTFLVDAGANFYTYFEGQKVNLGVRVLNTALDAREGLLGRIHVLDRATGAEACVPEFAISAAPGAEQRFEKEWMPETWPEKGYAVRAELYDGEELFDYAQHDAYVWRPDSEPRFITVQDGEFVLGGARWRAHGVNYMPSSGIGTEDQQYFEHWIGAGAYDPEIIDRDLRHIVDMGMNAVSVFIYHESLAAQNLLDLLRRCDTFGIKVNLSLRPGTPLEFEWDKMRELLECYRIREHDCVFALDLAWEPMFGNHGDRKRWDNRWREWVIERYGSVENAERDWGFEAPRDDAGLISNPLSNQTVEDGPWRVMVAAYRRFLDTLLYEYYSKARDLVRTVDPVHLVSFRMTEAGNPTFFWGERIPYDFSYLAAAVDMLAPEAYGRIGDWEKVKPGWFEYEYARWAAPQLPMIWAEAGVSAWSLNKMTSTPDMLQFQADYYTNLYKMFIGSGADGIFFWWYPGGYRTNERSDYGIINPDGSDRPVTRVIRDNAAAFIDGPSAKPVTDWLVIDRDAHAAGIAGAYDKVKDTFWALVAEGKTPGLKTDATGTTSADCPLIAVGNTAFDGTNPPKYLDGFFDRVEVLDASGAWVAIERGAAVNVLAGAPVKARMRVTNLGEARWLASQPEAKAGAVHIVTEGDRTSLIALPSDVPRHGSCELADVVLREAALDVPERVILTFESKDRAKFGPQFQFTIEPGQ